MCYSSGWDGVIGRTSGMVFNSKKEKNKECGREYTKTPFAILKILALICSIITFSLAVAGDHFFVYAPMILYQVVYIAITVALIIDLIIRTVGINVTTDAACKIDVTFCVVYLFMGLITTSLLIGTCIEPYFKVLGLAAFGQLNLPENFGMANGGLTPYSAKFPNKFPALKYDFSIEGQEPVEAKDDISKDENKNFESRKESHPKSKGLQFPKVVKVNEDLFTNKQNLVYPNTGYYAPHATQVRVQYQAKINQKKMSTLNPEMDRAKYFNSQIFRYLFDTTLDPLQSRPLDPDGFRKKFKNFKFQSDDNKLSPEEKEILKKLLEEKEKSLTESWKPEPEVSVTPKAVIQEEKPEERSPLEEFAPASYRYLKSSAGKIDPTTFILLIVSIVAAMLTMIFLGLIIILRMWLM